MADSNGKGNKAVVSALEDLLGGTFAFFVRAWSAHWNVRGPQFHELHAMFGDLYGDLYAATDQTAEKIRQLGYFAPCGVHDFARMYDMFNDPHESGEASALLRDLVTMNSETINLLREVYDEANAAGLLGLTNWTQDRIAKHDDWRWRLTAQQGQ